MGTGETSLASFKIISHETEVTVQPLKLISRADVEHESLGTARLFESRYQQLLDFLHGDSVMLLARIQEHDSRNKRSIVIERLDDSLFCYHQCLRSLAGDLEARKNLMSSSAICQTQPALPDFSSANWWKRFEVDQHELSREPPLLLDIGQQSLALEASIAECRQTFASVMSELEDAFFEMLYISRASLVVFTKNILSKYRQRVADVGATPGNYAEHILKVMMPTLQKLDLKYKSWLPEHIKAIIAGKQTDHGDLSVIETKTINQWLRRCQDEMVSCTSEHVCTSLLPGIKAREYQLLILLLLEVLVMDEAGSSNRERPMSSDLQDPALLIDVLLDRLAISQSLNFSQDNDELGTFCLEVLNPFYGAKLPRLLETISTKCLPHDDFASQMPNTPAKPLKTRKERKERKSVPSNSASLKRTRSAPADLLSEKRMPPKKRNLGREVSMSKRAPSFEVSSVKPAYLKSSISFEEKRRLKNESETQERIQVGQTPSKLRSLNNTSLMLQCLHDEAISQIEIGKHSKASFMAIGETPVKKRPSETVSQTPLQAFQTPTRAKESTFVAPFDGIQDTPTGRSILFKLDSPTVPSRSPRRSSRSNQSSPEQFRRPPTMRKSVTFSGSFASGSIANLPQNVKSPAPALIRKQNQTINDFFGPEIATPGGSARASRSESSIGDAEAQDHTEADPERFLAAELDWL